MIQSAAQGRNYGVGSYNDRQNFLSDIHHLLGRNITVPGQYSTGYGSAGVVVNEVDGVNQSSYFTIAKKYVYAGYRQVAMVGYYFESETKPASRSSNYKNLSYTAPTFMYRLNEEGYRAGLVSGIMRDVSAPIIGGIGLMTLGLVSIRRKNKP